MNTSPNVAVVSGAAQGLGYAVADEFASRGMRIVLADMNLEGAEASAQSLRRRHGVVTLAVHVDVGDADGLDDLAAHTLAEFGRVDILVNAAGIAEDAETLAVSNETLQRVLQ